MMKKAKDVSLFKKQDLATITKNTAVIRKKIDTDGEEDMRREIRDPKPARQKKRLA